MKWPVPREWPSPSATGANWWMAWAPGGPACTAIRCRSSMRPPPPSSARCPTWCLAAWPMLRRWSSAASWWKSPQRGWIGCFWQIPARWRWRWPSRWPSSTGTPRARPEPNSLLCAAAITATPSAPWACAIRMAACTSSTRASCPSTISWQHRTVAFTPSGTRVAWWSWRRLWQIITRKSPPSCSNP